MLEQSGMKGSVPAWGYDVAWPNAQHVSAHSFKTQPVVCGRNPSVCFHVGIEWEGIKGTRTQGCADTISPLMIRSGFKILTHTLLPFWPKCNESKAWSVNTEIPQAIVFPIRVPGMKGASWIRCHGTNSHTQTSKPKIFQGLRSCCLGGSGETKDVHTHGLGRGISAFHLCGNVVYVGSGSWTSLAYSPADKSAVGRLLDFVQAKTTRSLMQLWKIQKQYGRPDRGWCWGQNFPLEIVVKYHLFIGGCSKIMIPILAVFRKPKLKIVQL